MELDPYIAFRWILGTFVTIYASVVTIMSLWQWYIWLATQDKYISLVRRYIIVQGLRLRFRSFGGDLAVSILLCIAFVLLWRANHVMDEIYAVARTVPADVRHASP
jgi:hypothetical protein